MIYRQIVQIHFKQSPFPPVKSIKQIVTTRWQCCNLFSVFQQLRHCGQNTASQKQFHMKKYTEPSIVASVSNISDWLYGRNVRDPIFSTPSALHYIDFSLFFSHWSHWRWSHTISSKKHFSERVLDKTLKWQHSLHDVSTTARVSVNLRV